jgi:hypothetical protein
MCDDRHAHSNDASQVDETLRAVSRRRFMRIFGGSTAAGLVIGNRAWPSPAQASPIDGTQALSMAMHVHASFSELTGSMAAQLAQAEQNAIDVVWWTDHDHRMAARGYRSVVHFTSLTAEGGDGKPWQWVKRTSGPLTSTSSGGIDTSVNSPRDTVTGGSLSLRSQSTSTKAAKLGFYADSHPAGMNYRGNIHGQTWALEVLPSSIGSKAYLELLVASSFHPATSGRYAGAYTLSYRFGGSGTPGTRVQKGRTGIVNVAVTAGQWNSVVLNPADDIAALWPEMDPRDFASFGLTLSAVSTGPLASGYFDYLRFQREHTSGNVPIETQRAISTGYASRFPGVSAQQGLEISAYSPHINWFGGSVTLPTYEGVTSTDTYQALLAQQVDSIHAAGGLASYNHPYGTVGGSALTPDTQDAKTTQVAEALLTNRAFGCDILEVGYQLRGRMDLAHHVKLWDVLSRNARFLTGNGVNDDHSGRNWYGLANNWVTYVWANGTAEADLLRALEAGRSWCGSLSRFRGGLDLLADDLCPMGSATVSLLPQRQVQVVATGLPTGASVRVMRGTVDYAGTADASANTGPIATYTDADLAAGQVALTVDTTTSCFVRTEVVSSGGAVVALSNPLWLLRERPPGGIPAARDCA